MTLFEFLNEIYDKDYNLDFYHEQILLQEYAKYEEIEW